MIVFEIASAEVGEIFEQDGEPVGFAALIITNHGNRQRVRYAFTEIDLLSIEKGDFDLDRLIADELDRQCASLIAYLQKTVEGCEADAKGNVKRGKPAPVAPRPRHALVGKVLDRETKTLIEKPEVEVKPDG